MSRPVATTPKETEEDAARRERAQRITAVAELTARVVRDLADLVRDHADTIAGWTLRRR